MRRSNRITRLVRAETVLLGALAFALVTATAARADDDEDDSGSWTERIGDKVKNTMDGLGSKVGLGGKSDAPPPKEAPSGCPTIGILDGTAASREMAAGASGNQGVRHQFSLATVGRQCSVSGGRILLKVAATGRVLLGPAGSAGRFDVPLRVVVFSESQQKPVVSKLFKVPSSIAAGQGAVPFQFVSDTIAVPGSANPVAEYSIKVGLDSGKGGGDVATGRKGRRKAQSASATQ